jgi:lactaldehyde reductase
VLDEAKIPYELYSNIKPNPSIENVQTGVKRLQADPGPTASSPSAAVPPWTPRRPSASSSSNPEFADVRSLEGVAPTKKHAVFTIAVPTTAGTAAEVTINYVITDVEKKRKFVCVDTNDIPDCRRRRPGHDVLHAEGDSPPPPAWTP